MMFSVVLVVVCMAFCGLCVDAGALANPRPRGFSVTGFLRMHNTEIPPAMLEEKFNKLHTSPFVFYRGANQLYFRDWSNNPALADYGSEATAVWTQADLHIEVSARGAGTFLFSFFSFS